MATSTQDGKTSLQIPADAPYTIHSHPNHFNGGAAGGQPSGVDIATAKRLGKYVYVVSKSGLSYVSPAGDTGVVYANPSAFISKK